MKTISRDMQYFDSAIYTFTNAAIKTELKKKAKEKGVSLFYVIDEALRNYLKITNKNLPEPKIPKLV